LKAILVTISPSCSAVEYSPVKYSSAVTCRLFVVTVAASANTADG